MKWRASECNQVYLNCRAQPTLYKAERLSNSALSPAACPWASNGASGFYGFCLYWKNIQPTDIYKYACFLYAKLGNANELKEHTAENPVENRNFLGDIFYLLRDNFS